MTLPQVVLVLAVVFPRREFDAQLALEILAYQQRRNHAASLSHRKRRIALVTQRECSFVVVLGHLHKPSAAHRHWPSRSTQRSTTSSIVVAWSRDS